MAKNKLRLNFNSSEDLVHQASVEAGLAGYEIGEVYHTYDALRMWKDHFEGLYGRLKYCVHYSNPDDPPDLVLQFSRAQIEVEHTRFEPSHYGWMRSVQKQFPRSITRIPSNSDKPKNRENLVSSMYDRRYRFLDSTEEMSSWKKFAQDLILRKIEKRESGVLVIQDVSFFLKYKVNPIVEHIHSFLCQELKEKIGWTILFHSRMNSSEYISCMIRAGWDLQIRSNGSI